MKLLKRGLPVSAVEAAARRVASRDAAFVHQLVPKAAHNRRRSSARLSPEESERVVRLMSVWSFAEGVWGGEAGARRFLLKPHPLLDGRTPLAVTLSSELGGRLVRDLLGRLAYGSAV